MEIKVSYFTVVREERTRYVTSAGTNLDAYAIKVRAGDLSAFDSIDQLIRPAIRTRQRRFDSGNDVSCAVSVSEVRRQQGTLQKLCIAILPFKNVRLY